MSNPVLNIRPMAPSDLQLALDWAATEGWNPGLHDTIAFYDTDPAGFWTAEVNGEPIACVSTVCYDATFAFIGLFIVKSGWRGKGYGKQIWQTAWQQLISRLDPTQYTVGLDGVVEREATYQKSGFISAYRHIRYVYETNNTHTLSASVTPLVDIPFADVLHYDAAIFPARRPQFLQPWITVPGGTAYGVLENGRLTGYGVLRPCRQGFKIGPLFADSCEIAECLLQAFTNFAAPQPVYLDIPDVNPAMTWLTHRYNLQSVFTCIRMYHGKTPITDSNRIFGVTSLELG